MSGGETDSSTCSIGSSPESSRKTEYSHGRLSFSIDSILDPHFGGQRIEERSCSPENTSNRCAVSPSSPSLLSPLPLLSSLSDPRIQYPAWVFCTRYSDRPSAVSGSRSRRPRKRDSPSEEEKRPRTAFTTQQLQRLKQQFMDSRYLTEKRRQELAHELGLNESQIKIWFQNKRAKLKKASGGMKSSPPSLALHQLMTHGLINTSILNQQSM